MKTSVTAAFIFILLGASAPSAAITNFSVSAPTPDLARAVVDRAEEVVRVVSIKWFNNVRPEWASPIYVDVVLTHEEEMDGHILRLKFHNSIYQHIVVKGGSADIILQDAVAHEVTHAVVFDRLGSDPPLWFSEGLAVMHEGGARFHLAGGGGAPPLPLNILFRVTDYPSDWRSYYRQCYLVTQYLARRFGRRAVLAFAREGMQSRDWEAASLRVFRVSLEQLDESYELESGEDH
jgi:hypothetical protein